MFESLWHVNARISGWNGCACCTVTQRCKNIFKVCIHNIRFPAHCSSELSCKNDFYCTAVNFLYTLICSLHLSCVCIMYIIKHCMFCNTGQEGVVHQRRGKIGRIYWCFCRPPILAPNDDVGDDMPSKSVGEQAPIWCYQGPYFYPVHHFNQVNIINLVEH